ncbi:MAG: hypothetical protein IJ958_03855 [Agathobacter sp.]|nr:hypothetical protein [Agathobacter sp.]
MKKTLKRVLVLALAAAMTLSLAACGGKDNEEVAEYTYNVYMEASPTNWNPHTWEMNADSEIMSYIEMGLVDVQIAEDGVNFEWVYEMAEDINDITATYADKEKWGITDDAGRVWEIKLNKDAKWADGTVINADTYVYSMQQLLSPEMKNYRAGNYVDGDSAILGAAGYFNNDLAGQVKYAEATDDTAEKYFFSADAVMASTLGDSLAAYIEAGYAASYPTMAPFEAYIGQGYVEVTDETKALLEALAKETCGDDYSWYHMCFVEDGVYEETPWEEVGLVKVDDYTILYITAIPIDEFNFNTACTSNWIVYEDLYEKGKSTTGDLTATNYGTSADTYMSFGPYKLASFETDKQFVLEKNDQWYGWTDGKHEGQYQTTKVVYQIVADHNTQLQLFNQGKLDSVALTADDMATYKMSDYLLQTDQTYTFRWIFASDLEALKALEVEANDGSNKRVLSYDDFRKAISYSMDRAKFCTEATSAYKPAFVLLNSLYYYDIANDTESIYRNTDEAKKAILDVYDVEVTADTDLDAEVAKITGYDVEAAKALFQSVYEQAKADGNYTDGQKIVINCCASAASDLSAEDKTQETLMNEFVAAATVGTGFEGMIEFKFESGRTDRYGDVAAGKIEMIRGAWGGAAFYPFNAMRCYTDATYAGTIHESCGWDPAVDTLDITYDFDGDGTAETVTDTYLNWSQAVAAGGKLSGDAATRLYVLASVEAAVVKTYQCIPWASETQCSLYSQKQNMGTTTYNIMYGYGGIRHMTYNFTDAEWDAYVQEQGGTLSYE